MDSHTMAHRWTNQDFGRNNGFKSKILIVTSGITTAIQL